MCAPIPKTESAGGAASPTRTLNTPATQSAVSAGATTSPQIGPAKPVSRHPTWFGAGAGNADGPKPKKVKNAVVLQGDPNAATALAADRQHRPAMGATRADDAPRPAAQGARAGLHRVAPRVAAVRQRRALPRVAGAAAADAGPVRDRGPSPGPGPFDGGTPKNRWAGPTGLPSLSHARRSSLLSVPLPPLLLPLTKAFQPLNVANARI